MLSIVLSRPGLKRLDAYVDDIMWDMLGVPGNGYPLDAPPLKTMALVKNLWALYCLWKVRWVSPRQRVFSAAIEASWALPKARKVHGARFDIY